MAITLKDFIETKGIKHCAKLFKTTDPTICSWKKLRYVPHPCQAKNIIRTTKGLLTYEGIYDPYIEAREKAGKSKAK